MWFQITGGWINEGYKSKEMAVLSILSWHKKVAAITRWSYYEVAIIAGPPLYIFNDKELF